MIMLQCTEVRILSIITAIFQAIGQAICFIFPLSEGGHTAIFNDFSGRYTGVATELTGLIHIGIAIGILVAFYKVFVCLVYDFFSMWKDAFTKKLDVKNISSRRKFMLYTFIPYIFMILYAVPAGDKGNVYEAIRAISYDGNLLSEGIFFIVSAVLVFVSSFVLAKNEKGKRLTIVPAVVLGAAIFFAIPVAGLSLSAVIISIAVLFGVNRNIAVRYFASVSVPVLIVMAIVEIVKCTVYVNIIPGIIAVILSGAVTYFACAFLKRFVKNNDLKYFSFYDFAIGVIITIVGIVEIITK